MNKIFKWLPLFFAVSLTLVFLVPNPVFASPGTSTVDARPTAYTETGGMIGKVADQIDAYDNDLNTFADFKYDEFTGTFEVDTFTTPSSNLIISVDFKMNYYADAGGGIDPGYRIVYYVGASGPVVLVALTIAGHAQATETWLSQAEPNDGTWSWTDIGNIRIVVETNAGKKGDYFEEYEAWVTVTTYSYTVGTMFVDPASLTDPSSPFTVDIEVSSVEDLYGWEFKLYYDNTILSNSSVTEGSFLLSGGSTYFSVLNNTDTYNATHGRFWVTCTLLGHTAGKTGSGVLATISFTVDGTAGTTPLSLEDTKLVGYIYSTSTLIQMSHNTADGQVTITALPEFPFGAALEIALVGVIVYIWWRKRKQSRKLLDKANVSLTHCACMQNLVI